jgi:preprotein translocase subunit Sec61beta
MEKINKYYEKTIAWIQVNPKKVILIGIFAVGLLVGALLF